MYERDVPQEEQELLYVAGPYRADVPRLIQKNIMQAGDVALELWQQGYAVICPHMNTALFDGCAPDDVWLKGDLTMLQRCDKLVLSFDWFSSSGTIAEIEFAQKHKIPVFVFETGAIEEVPYLRKFSQEDEDIIKVKAELKNWKNERY